MTDARGNHPDRLLWVMRRLGSLELERHNEPTDSARRREIDGEIADIQRDVMLRGAAGNGGPDEPTQPPKQEGEPHHQAGPFRA